MSTSSIRLELSCFVKQELHSLANYMMSTLTHQHVATTLSRHFPGKVTLPCALCLPVMGRKSAVLQAEQCCLWMWLSCCTFIMSPGVFDVTRSRRG